ncbi:MAG TPA: Stp1/IreP family PP2C-type Ser/Thr phosphatase [Erysipelotrichaceae bacterium]|nr:Stp1/IreP family PP2C-type Ser/Thr phosphatase [Erysipelotrichaceae bacterium]
MIIQGITDIGKIRRINQDNFLILQNKDVQLMLVADGMGGAKAGEIASLLACESIERQFNGMDFNELTIIEAKQWLKKAILTMNKEVYQASVENPDYSGMGTTAVAALFFEDVCLVANVGDSRCYIVNTAHEFIQISIDHSLVNEMVRLKRITAEQAKTHPQRSVLTNVCGVIPNIDIDIFEVHDFSLVMCCSDGVHSMLDDREIFSLLKSKETTASKVQHILHHANLHGGLDNITLTIAERGRL